MVVEVIDANNFILAQYGFFDLPAGHPWIVGQKYYLDDTTAGAVVQTMPVLEDVFVQVCFEVLSATEIKVIDQAVLENTTMTTEY